MEHDAPVTYVIVFKGSHSDLLVIYCKQQSAKVSMHDYGPGNRSDGQKHPRNQSWEVVPCFGLFACLCGGVLLFFINKTSEFVANSPAYYSSKPGPLSPYHWAQGMQLVVMKCELSGGLVYLMLSSLKTKSISGVLLESVEVFKRLKSSTTVSDSTFEAGYGLSV